MRKITDPTSNIAEYSVSEISCALKHTIEDAFGYIRIRGEISGYRGPHSSGHAYFSLKDDLARIEAVVWRGHMNRLRFLLEEGIEVVAIGKLTTYPSSSKYQLVIEQLEPSGAGALMALLEKRKQKLTAEGLFDPTIKQFLPYMPRIIGVVTSPTGAVLRDIIHRIADRFPLHVIVWPVRVQGETCGLEVAAAIDGFNSFASGTSFPRPDVLIIARGGGSLEDLWGFNDEIVVRSVAASQIPVISAIGHETDWTLIDFVADMRAPTPTAAAEMAVPVKIDIQSLVASLTVRFSSVMTRVLYQKGQTYRALSRALPSADQFLALSRRLLDEISARLVRELHANTQKQRTHFNSHARQLSSSLLTRCIAEQWREGETLALRLPRSLHIYLRDQRHCFSRSAERLSLRPIQHASILARQMLNQSYRKGDQAIGLILAQCRRRNGELERLMRTLSHENILERGFAIIFDASGHLVKQAAAIHPGDPLLLRFHDGDIQAVAGKNET